METHPAFKIVIAYETFAAAIQAKTMSEQVVHQTESECDAWPFDLPSVGLIRERAIAAAAAADMIIVAASGAVELPDAVKEWIEHGLRQKGGSRAALVALPLDDWPISDEPLPLCACLQQIAERGGEDFFCNLRRWQQDAIESGYQLPEPYSRMREAVAPEYAASSGWGIND
jgi:hypothetical protein